MSKFVITIAPDDAAGGAGGALTTVRVDMSTGQARITELTVRAAADGGLAPSDLPPIDMGLLIRALTVAAAPQALAAAAAPVSTQTSAVDAVPEPSGSDVVAAARSVDEPTEPVSRRRARKAAAATGPAKKAASRKSGGRKPAADKVTAGKKATAANSTPKAASRRSRAAESAAGAPRAYRRMPDPEQVMDVYRQTGSITAVAEHFSVPRHTVAGWARRLRTQGHTIGRQ